MGNSLTLELGDAVTISIDGEIDKYVVTQRIDRSTPSSPEITLRSFRMDGKTIVISNIMKPVLKAGKYNKLHSK